MRAKLLIVELIYRIHVILQKEKKSHKIVKFSKLRVHLLQHNTGDINSLLEILSK